MPSEKAPVLLFQKLYFNLPHNSERTISDWLVRFRVQRQNGLTKRIWCSENCMGRRLLTAWSSRMECHHMSSLVSDHSHHITRSSKIKFYRKYKRKLEFKGVKNIENRYFQFFKVFYPKLVKNLGFIQVLFHTRCFDSPTPTASSRQPHKEPE